MANLVQPSDILKELVLKITTSKRRERERILLAVTSLLENGKDVQDNTVKGILKTLSLTLSRYQDKKSRQYVAKVLVSLASSNGPATLSCMTSVLSEIKQTSVATQSTSRLCLSALVWTAIVCRSLFKSADDCKEQSFTKLVALQAQLLDGSLAARKSVLSKSAYNKLRRIWKMVPGTAELYGDAMLAGDAGMSGVCMLACLMRFWSETKNVAAISNYKKRFLEVYIKVVLSSKTRPPVHILEWSKWLLRHATHEEFKGIFLPAVTKAMLRSPEIILEGVGHLLSGLSIDLSAYASDLGKNIGTNLYSKDEGSREEACVATKHLAKQCSDPDAIESLTRHYFSILNGAEGKLSLAVQRTSVLSGIGSLSNNAVAGSATQSLTAAVADMFVPLLQQEVHEGTLVHALAQLSAWCERFTTRVPDKLVAFFRTGIALKSSTSPVRNAYLLCMNAAFSRRDALPQARELLPVLLKTVEKAAGQSNQMLLVTEAVSASRILVKLAAVYDDIDNELTTFWSTILDPKKQLLVSEKYLLAAGDDAALYGLTRLVESLVMAHPQRMDAHIAKPFYRAVVYAMTRSSWQLRSSVAASVRKLMSSLGGASLALSFLAEFKDMLAMQKIGYDLVKADACDPDDRDAQSKRAGRILAEANAAFAAVPDLTARDADLIAMETLLTAHHPLVVMENPDLWTDVLCLMHVDAGEFVSRHADAIVVMLDAEPTLDETWRNVIATLARVSPRAAMPKLVDHVIGCLDDVGAQQISLADYAVYMTPEGDVYDKSVIESIKDEDQKGNIKRESKVYSYKEQLADLELRKELEKKKKNKEEKPQLSKKQQEMLKLQLEKESRTRANLKKLDVRLSKSMGIVSAIVDGNAGGAAVHLPRLLEGLLRLLPSPLAAPHATRAFLQLSACDYTDDLKHLGDLIGHVTLRMLEPACELDSWWCQEALQTAVRRAVAIVHATTAADKHAERFSAPGFAYCFPLLESVLRRGGAAVGGDENVLCQALKVISTHANLRNPDADTDDDDDEASVHGPDLLPRRQMLQLLTHVVGTSVGRLHQMACKAMLETAVCASGIDGCASATQGEIDVLLLGLQSPALTVRETALQCLMAMMLVLPLPDEEMDEEQGMQLVQRVWVVRHDEEEAIQILALRLWDETGMSVAAAMCSRLIDDVIHDEGVVRRAAAEAMSRALELHRGRMDAALSAIYNTYATKLKVVPPVLDQFGRLVAEEGLDEWPARSGLALTIGKLSPYLTEDQIGQLFTFFVEEGLADRNEEVRNHMLMSAVVVITDHGKECVNLLLPVFEDFLDKAPPSGRFDAVRQSVVILMGSLARHLDTDDPKVKPIVAKLVATLTTPSQKVQEAVANCLPPLVPAIKAEAPELVKKLLQLLLESENYAERKGAAYGLAGLVKGLGILALKQLEIMPQLQEAIQDKKNYKHREGALFAFEMLCHMLGRLFEPYIVHVLPHLLLCFGDANQFVREAADETAKEVMSKLSAHGVKLVLPSLLAALEEESWRTKTGSVELLGAMAFCAPKQLSSCLPSIVPKLIEVLSDSHVKVQKAGAQALKQIGNVIRNPEIQAIVPVLLGALQDPSKKTSTSLQTLLETKFVHFVDAPSLALIMPVVQRAFQDRSTEVRKMASQIMGNMYSLTDQKDLAPYLPTVIPGLKQSLLDPVPEVRAVSARALGAMVKGMGEQCFDDLLPWLMQTLTSEQSSVDRSGAAQGLSEVVGALGVEKLHKLMPDIIQTAERTDIAPCVKDGYIMLSIYLPGVFGHHFQPYVGLIITPILKALADESEFVRETALRAGQRIVHLYAETAIELFLPELEKGLFDDNWRIRYSSVQLLGDLLYKVSGVSGKMTTEGDEDDNFGTETSQKAVMEILGSDRRNRVLAGLYMGRSDVALLVRQSALHVWKVIVTNTARTLREILPTLFQLLLGCLASQSYDKRQVAARTLGDLVRKLGERVLPEIIPILERGLESPQPDQRQGVCVGLSEIMKNCSREMVLMYVDSVVPTVRKALCDPLPEVRMAAAKTFDNLHATIGPKALDDILPHLLQQLDDPVMAERTLDGLTQVMAIKSRVVLPYLVPQLTAPPVNTKALAFLSSVAGEALNKHLSKILPALLKAMSEDSAPEDQVLEYSQQVVLAVTDDDGVRIVLGELLEVTRCQQVALRRGACTLLHAFCSQTRADYSAHVPQLIGGLVNLLRDDDPQVLQMSWNALSAVTKTLDAAEQLQHVTTLRQAVRFAILDFKKELLPGFCLPKGLTPILPIYREGILNGPPELKEQASIGLGEVIKLTSPEALKPSVVNITGPLIRILGDRFSANVKVSVLDTLGLLLGKVGAMLKPFLPQLQTTFIKALNDPSRLVRLHAANALGKLILIHPRVDPLVTELSTAVRTADDSGIRETTLQALRDVIGGAGERLSDGIKNGLLSLLVAYLPHPEDTTRMSAAGCLGALCRHLPEFELQALLIEQLLDNDPTADWMLRHGRATALSVALKEAPHVVFQLMQDRAVESALANTSTDRIPIALAGIRSLGFILHWQLQEDVQTLPQVISTLGKCMNHSSNEVKQVAAQVCSYLARGRAPASLPLPAIRSLAPMLVNGTKEKNTAVRSSSEHALVALLRLRSGDTTYQDVLGILDPGPSDSLTDTYAKSLRKLATQPEPREEEIDNTLLQ